MIPPTAAYAKKMARQAGTKAHPRNACSALTTHPQAIMPKAVPAVPMSEYQAKMSLRSSWGVRCARVDSSTARKGPISLPL